MFLIYKVKSHQGFSYDQASPVLLESSDQKVESLTGSVTVTTNLSVMDDKTQETESLLIQNSKLFYYMNPFFMRMALYIRCCRKKIALDLKPYISVVNYNLAEKKIISLKMPIFLLPKKVCNLTDMQTLIRTLIVL